jgi:DNA polymerase-3 subunit delta'
MTTVPAPVGHDAALTHLREALAADRLHHAWLLEGPAGVGKRTVADWLVLTANCLSDGDDGARPCGACASCRQILAGTHPDVVVVGPDPEKATRAIPVDAVREAIRVCGLHRFSARRRFVIVEPADALAPQGANALLKTLEEPPADTHFLLIAPHARGLLPTIVSRCQRLRLVPVPEGTLAPWLAARGLADAERLARLAQGCPGKALALADGGLDARTELRARLLKAVAGDLQAIFGLSEALTKDGRRQEWMAAVEPLLEILEELLRDVVVTATRPGEPRLHGDLPPVIEAWTRALWPGGVERLVAALADCRQDLALNVTGKTALDALLTRVATELGAARKVGASALQGP